MKKTVKCNEMEALARALQVAKDNRTISEEQAGALHARFRLEDQTGGVWTVGIRTLRWHRLVQDRWVADNPPAQLFIEEATLAEVGKLLPPASKPAPPAAPPKKDSPPMGVSAAAPKPGSPPAKPAAPAQPKPAAAQFCTGCGHSLRPGTKFCTHCGKRLV
jgi:hypothetical protein